MPTLHEELGSRVRSWREAGYPCEEFPAIGEILEFSTDPEHGALRYLRQPQLRALETYWHLRLVEKTPHIFDLYTKYFPSNKNLSALLEALGIPEGALKASNYDVDRLWERLRSDDRFVKDFRLEALRETVSLPYSSYILALAMGAGKTVLIGAIVATEFGMAIEYPDGPFVQNALVFAPGKTIIESLRELAEIPYEKILPPRFLKTFASSIKLTFTRDGEKDIPVIRGSAWNVIVTNTEKIRIQKETIRKSEIGERSLLGDEDAARREVANLRLRAIASLPHLAVFSDEAHHTYGQSLDTGLKRVRQTVDYLAAATNVVCVVNTTGTPYYERQPLRDVIIWYGLSQGIRDNILKDVADNILSYDFSGDASRYVSEVMHDFFREYRDVRLPNGAAAKIAIYFPQTKDLRELKPVVEEVLVELGLPPTLLLVNTSDEELTQKADEDAFNRLNHPDAPHRVILLVNKGTEGWNCPSLFATALARKLTTSNNFVLQAATRCLRQVPGNGKKARIYLSTENFKILDRQLQETYGETIHEFNHAAQEMSRGRLVLKKLALPPLVVTQVVRTVVRKASEGSPLELRRPNVSSGSLKRTVLTPAEGVASGVLRQIGDTVELQAMSASLDLYTASAELAARYRCDHWQMLDQLRAIYGAEDVPLPHLDSLSEQIERQTRNYEVREEKVDVALALVRPEGFTKEMSAEGPEIYTAEILYPKDREHLILYRATKAKDNKLDLGFHFDPYNFDSKPEQSFFEQMLFQLNISPKDVEDIYFTGSITDPAKTEFFVDYKDEKGKWRRYTPDFVIRMKPKKGGKSGTGKVLIVEIKAERERNDALDGENGRKAIALRKWEDLNPDRLRYEMIFTATDSVSNDQMRAAVKFIEDAGAPNAQEG